jgi:hypothetical protein
MESGGLNFCEMIDAGIPWRAGLLFFAYLVPVVVVAGWLSGSKTGWLRAVGSVLLGVVLLVSIVMSVYSFPNGITDESCNTPIDYRITGPSLVALNIGLFLTARLARAARTGLGRLFGS